MEADGDAGGSRGPSPGITQKTPPRVGEGQGERSVLSHGSSGGPP